MNSRLNDARKDPLLHRIHIHTFKCTSTFEQKAKFLVHKKEALACLHILFNGDKNKQKITINRKKKTEKSESNWQIWKVLYVSKLQCID